MISTGLALALYCERSQECMGRLNPFRFVRVPGLLGRLDNGLFCAESVA